MQWPTLRGEGHVWPATEAICAALAILGTVLALWTNAQFESGTVNPAFDQLCFLASRSLADILRLAALSLLWFISRTQKWPGWCLAVALAILTLSNWKPLDRAAYYYSSQWKAEYVDTYKSRIHRVYGQGRIAEALRITKRAEDALQGPGLFDGELAIWKAKFETSVNLSDFWLNKNTPHSIAAWTPDRGPELPLELLEALRLNPQSEKAAQYLKMLFGKVATAISRVDRGETENIGAIVRPEDRKLFELTVKRADLARSLKIYWHLAETECQLAIGELIRTGTGEIPLNIAIARLPRCQGLVTAPVQPTTPVRLPDIVNSTAPTY